MLCVFARSEQGPRRADRGRRWEGVDATYRYATLGLRGNSLRHIRFRDVRVPPENVLGEAGDGFRMSLGAG